MNETSHRQDWAVARARILERMAELRLDVVDLARGAGLSEKHVRTLINHAAEVAPRDKTRWALCDALRWTPDSIDRILAGGEPVAVDVDASGEVSRIDLLYGRVEEMGSLQAAALETLRQQQLEMSKFWKILQRVEGDLRHVQGELAELRRARDQAAPDSP